MKKLICILLISVTIGLQAQENEDLITPEQMVKNFFEAFHDQDAESLKSYAYETTKLISIHKNESGKTELTESDYSEFVKNIVSIPENATFEEKLHEYRVEENGLLATVTTPYSFYYNGKLSHCGVNSFQLVKFEGDWKIVSIMDTRTKENCD